MTPAPPKMAVRSLVKTFPARRRRGPAVVALDGVDLEVPAGAMVGIVGASGCGKSTLLAIAAGLETPTSGVVEVDGDRVVGPGPDRGMVFQAFSLYPWKSVRANIAFGLECAGTPRGDRAARVDELLGVTGLTAFADTLPHQLSGGMRQRVAIARALAPAPDILLLDEPFGALDTLTRRELHRQFLDLRALLPKTMVLVTHDLGEAFRLADRIGVMRRGRLLQLGPAEELRERPADEYVRELLG